MFKFLNVKSLKRRGFTTMELLVVIGIIVFLIVLTLPNYRSGERQLVLQRATHKLAQDLRRAQEMAVSAAVSEKTGMEVPLGGYGIRFSIAEAKKYTLYGDKNNNHEYDGALTDYSIEDINLEKGIVIVNLQTDKASRSNISITFVPPDPKVYITDDPERLWARITLAIERDLAKTQIIYVNNAGLIAIE